MPEDDTGPPASPDSAFLEYERPIRVRNYKLGALLAGIFMPAGATLDYFTHGWSTMLTLLPNRMICAVLLGTIWMLLHFHPDTKRYRLLGFGVAFLPLLSISWMIYDLGGATSTYYAGLNLIMVGSAILLRWTVTDSVIIVVLTFVTYLLVCLMRGSVVDVGGVFFNNIYFLLVTGVFLVAGSWYYNGVRRSEFDLRWRLDQNRAELEASNRKLKELDELKGRFFANISHELRTPLTLLIAPLETLQNRSVRLPEEEEKDLLATMHGNSMRLLKLINDLLDLVRMEAGTMQVNLRKLEVDGFVQGLANAVRPVAQDKRVRIHTHVDEDIGTVMVDPEKVERICLNLLFNAIKFTAAGGFVEFSAIRDDKWLVLEVRDTGMGISPENLQQLFTRFFQADTSSQRKFQGMGIGLALVKELAEVQGGSVGATSELGKGTVMTVKLPFKVAEEIPVVEEKPEALAEGAVPVEEEGPEWISTLYRRAEMFPAMTSLQATIRPVETGSGHTRKPKLLIADDEPDMLRFLRGQLSANFDVLEAVDGRQAVEKAAQFLPEIILTDMMMPEMDGLQVCRELRNRTSTRSIPVVLLTARADEHTKIECLAAGASDFLAKPFSMTEVNVRLKNLVDSYSYQRELVQQKQQLEAALEQIKETESLLLRNEKLASLGRMSAGLIHEINNPLNYARQGLHLLGQNTTLLPEGARAEFADTLKDVEEGVNRVVRIISDLRGFTRTTNETNQVFQVKPLAEKTLRFFAHEWKDGIRHEIEMPDGLEMRGDSNHIVQVLVNLIQNAIDAMRTKTYPEGESPCIKISGAIVGSHVEICVRDNGPGVPQAIRHQIFDPFFTTKDVGAGMGLGLAICHRVIEEHEGRIDLRSEPGVFTEFVLEFPSPDSIVANHDTALFPGHP